MKASSKKSSGGSGYLYKIINLPQSDKEVGFVENSGASPINIYSSTKDWSEFSKSSLISASSTGSSQAIVDSTILKRWLAGWTVKSNYVGDLTVVLNLGVIFKSDNGSDPVGYIEKTLDNLSLPLHFEKDSVSLISGPYISIETGCKIYTDTFPYGKFYIRSIVSVSAINSIGGGEVWEEVDLSNFPTDWKAYDRIKIQFAVTCTISASSYTGTATCSLGANNTLEYGGIYEFLIPDTNISFATPHTCIVASTPSNGVALAYVYIIYPYNKWNTENTIMVVEGAGFNGSYIAVGSDINIDRSNISTYVRKMWRLKK